MIKHQSPISGIDSYQDKYIATTGLGTLNIQNIGSGGRSSNVLFPVGSNSNSYTPASITNLGAMDEFKVRVMSGVNLIYNALLVPSGTALNSNVVNLSWAINEGVTFTTGFLLAGTAAADTRTGMMIISNLTSNTFTEISNNFSATTSVFFGAGSKTLSATLDRLRITTVNGTDTFDAGSINIMYE